MLTILILGLLLLALVTVMGVLLDSPDLLPEQYRQTAEGDLEPIAVDAA